MTPQAYPEVALAQSAISYRHEYCSRKTGQNGLLLQIGTDPSGSAFLLTLLVWLCSAPVPRKVFTFNACQPLVGDAVHLKGRVWIT